MHIPSQLVTRFKEARRVAVLTGAGISAESGIPTFRQAQSGLWAQYDPQELATAQAFQHNPLLVWDWYQWRRRLVAGASPNPGHHALVKMQAYYSQFTVITQNVDGLHQQAGSSPVIELHGNIRTNQCFNCQRPAGIQADLETKTIPHCPVCDGLLRPAVIWFGENLPEKALQAAWQAAQACDLFFSIGTSALVQPAASLPLIAQAHGAVLIEINPQPTPLSQRADFSLQAAAGEALPTLAKLLST